MEKMRSLLVPGSASEEVIDLAYWELKEGAPALAVVASGRYLLHRHDEMMSVWRDLAVLDRQTPEGRVGFLMYGIRATGRAVRINLWESPAAQTRTAQRLRDDGRWQALLARHERYAVPNVGVIERCEVAHGELRRAVGSGLPEA